MTELTQDQLAALKRAKAREGKTTPAPWAQCNPHRAWGIHYADCLKSQNEKVIFCNSVWDTSPTRLGSENPENLSLITDAPALQDLALAQANIIAEQAARIKALEMQLAETVKALQGVLVGYTATVIDKLAAPEIEP